MEDFYIKSLEVDDFEDYGTVIKVHACPYENTPIGYAPIENHGGTFIYPYSKSLLEQLEHYQEINDYRVNINSFEYKVVRNIYFDSKYYISPLFIEQLNDDIATNYQPIDLGVSVFWADKNYQANTPFDKGHMMSYEELKESDIPSGWRLPSARELEELLELTWSYRCDNGKYLTVDAKNRKHCIFPLSGIEMGGEILRVGEIAQYGSKEPEDNYVSFLMLSPSFQIINEFGSMNDKFSVRFVKDKEVDAEDDSIDKFIKAMEEEERWRLIDPGF